MNVYETEKIRNVVVLGHGGAGKTTMCGKVGFMLKKQGKKPLLVACDVYRPAAIDQLKQIGKQLNIDVYEEGKKNPVDIVRNAYNFAKENKMLKETNKVLLAEWEKESRRSYEKI